MKGSRISDIEKRIRQRSNRARTRRFSTKRHCVPGLSIENELKLVSNKARFMSGLISGDIKVIYRERGELFQEIIERGFDPIPIEWLPVATGHEKEEDEESPVQETTGYEYLTSITVRSFGDGTLRDLLKRKSELEEIIRSATPLCRRLTGLKISEEEPSMVDENYNEAQSDRDVWKDVTAKEIHVTEAAPWRRHKRTADESLEASAMLIDERS